MGLRWVFNGAPRNVVQLLKNEDRGFAPKTLRKTRGHITLPLIFIKLPLKVAKLQKCHSGSKMLAQLLECRENYVKTIFILRLIFKLLNCFTKIPKNN